MANENLNKGASSLPGGGDAQSSKDILNVGKETLSREGDINGQLKERLKNLDQVIKAHDKINDKVQLYNDLNRDIKSLEFDIHKNLIEQVKLEKQIASAGEDTLNRIKERYESVKKGLSDEKDATKKLNDLLTQSAVITEDKKEAHLELVKSAQEQLTLIVAQNEQLEGSLTTEEAMVIAAQEALEVRQKTNATLQAQLQLQTEIEDRMGSLGNLTKGLAGIVNKVGLGGFLQIDKTVDKMRLAAADGASKWSLLGIALKDIFTSVGKALTNPLVILGGIVALTTKLVKLAMEYQDKLFQAGKTLGMNLTQAEALTKEFQNMAMQNGQLAMTGRQLVDTYAQVNSSLGFIGPKNAEFLTTTTGIQRRIGATAEDMQSLQYFSAATGKSLQSSYASIVGSAKATAAKLKLDMSEKQILEGISKVSATIFNNFKGNVKQIAAAVVTATKLGVTLDQITSAGNNLLDFESSISKEFEAQLLTGKDLDLSRARQLALTGSTSELMTELNSKLGTYTEWNKMNVLQQQSYAEALGMSKEMVDEIFKKQELANALGKQAGADLQTQYATLQAQGKSHQEIADLMGQQSASDALRASASEKLQATMERINEAIGKMSTLFLPIIEKFANFVSDADKLKMAFRGIATVIGGIAGVSIGMSITRQRQLVTERQIALTNNRVLATMALQNTQETALLAKKELEQIAETGITRTKIFGAGASATAGAGYLGPLALGVGAAVIAGLMAYMGTGGGGGGGSAPMPSATSISPMNSNVANAAATENAVGPNRLSMGSAQAADKSLNFVMQVDGVPFGKVISNTLAKNSYAASGEATQMNPTA